MTDTPDTRRGDSHPDDELLFELVEQTIAPAKAVAVLAHVESCERCAALVEAASRTAARIADARALDEVPDEVTARVAAALDREWQLRYGERAGATTSPATGGRAASWWRRTSSRRPSVTAVGTAVLLIAAGLAFVWMPQGEDGGTGSGSDAGEQLASGPEAPPSQGQPEAMDEGVAGGASADTEPREAATQSSSSDAGSPVAVTAEVAIPEGCRFVRTGTQEPGEVVFREWPIVAGLGFSIVCPPPAP